MSQAPYSVILLEPLVGSMETLARVLEKSNQFELMRVPTHEEAYQAALQFDPCLLLVSIPAGQDGVGELALLRRLEKRVRAGSVRVLTISARKGHMIGRQTAGFGDYIEEPVPMKSIAFKVKLLMKALGAKQAETQAKSEEKVFRADAASDAASAAEVPSGYVPALQLGEDTFVFKKAKPRFHGGDIVLEAEGPLPETGEWVEEPDGESWRWVQKVGEDGEPRTDDGDGWVHKGKKPVYQPAKGKWELRSGMPELSFRRGGKLVASKVRLSDSGRVEIAEDSPEAVNNLMVNRTLASQARERLIKQVVSGQQRQEAGGAEPAAGPEEKGVTARNAGPGKEDEARPGQPEKPETVTEAERKRAKVSAIRERLRRQRGDGGKNTTDQDQDQDQDRGPASSENPGGDHAAGREANEAAAAATGELAEASLRAIDRIERKKATARRAASSGVEEGGPGPEAPVPGEEEPPGSKKRAVRKQNQRNGSGAREAHAEAEPKGQRERKTEMHDLPSEAESGAEEGGAEPAEEHVNAHAARRAAREGRTRERADPATAPEELTKSRRGHGSAAGEEEPGERAPAGSALERLESGAARRALARAERRRSPGEPGDEPVPDDAASTTTAAHDLTAQEAEGARDLRGPADRKERAFRAIETLGDEAGEMGVDRIAAEERANPARKEYFLDASEVQPFAGTWIESDEHFAYMPDEALDSGFSDMKELLPLWIYEGTEAPELIGARWRFWDLPPSLVESEADLPLNVRDTLAEIRGQAALALGHEPMPLPASLAKSVARRQLAAAEQEPEDAEISPIADGDPREGRESEREKKPRVDAQARGDAGLANAASNARGETETSSALHGDTGTDPETNAGSETAAAVEVVAEAESDLGADLEAESSAEAEIQVEDNVQTAAETAADDGEGDAALAEAESEVETGPEAADPAPAPNGGMPLTSLLVLAYLSDLRRLPDVPAPSLHALAGLLSAAIPSRVFIYTEQTPEKGAEALPAGPRGWFLVQAFSQGPLSFEEESLLLAAEAALPARKVAA